MRKRKEPEPASANRRWSVSWNLTQEQIDARREYCANPDVHGSTCVCIAYKKRGS